MPKSSLVLPLLLPSEAEAAGGLKDVPARADTQGGHGASKQAGRGASLHSVVFNIVNCTFGTGFFLFPRQFVHNGIFTSLVFLVVLLALVTFSLHVLNVAASNSPWSLTAYPETVAYFTHPYASPLISFTISVYLIGASSAYLALVADQAVALGLTDVPRSVLLAAPLLVAAPFSLLRSISSFTFTSAFGVVINSFVVLVLCYEASAKIWRDGIANQARHPHLCAHTTTRPV